VFQGAVAGGPDPLGGPSKSTTERRSSRQGCGSPARPGFPKFRKQSRGGTAAPVDVGASMSRRGIPKAYTADSGAAGTLALSALS